MDVYLPNETAKAIPPRRNPLYFGSEVSPMYTPVEVVIKPLNKPVINLPKKISFVLKAKYIESQPTANGTLDIVCVDFLPNVSLKYTPTIEPIAIGRTASEAVKNVHN